MGILSNEKSITVYSDTSPAKKKWLDAISKFIEEAQQSTVQDDSQGTATVWELDRHVKVCQVCNEVKFTTFNRRHHCRRCGRVVCGKCSTGRLPDLKNANKKVRACKVCYAKEKGEAPKDRTWSMSIASSTSQRSSTMASMSMTSSLHELKEEEEDNVEEDQVGAAVYQLSYYHGNIRSSDAKTLLEGSSLGKGAFLLCTPSGTSTATVAGGMGVPLVIHDPDAKAKIAQLIVVPGADKTSPVRFTLQGSEAPETTNQPMLDLIATLKRQGMIASPVPRLQGWRDKIGGSERASCIEAFEAQRRGDLTLREGDEVLLVEEKEDEGWCFGVSGDRLGMFPASKILRTNPSTLIGKVFSAVAPYEAPDDGDPKAQYLSLRVGDNITLQRVAEGWWLGANEEGQSGWFPKTYVRPPSSPASTNKADSASSIYDSSPSFAMTV